jgi:hypothetical protein
MVNVKNLALEILSLKRFKLYWDTVGESTAEKLTIERAESPDGDYIELGTVDDTQEYYIDETPTTHRKYIPCYYRIKHADGTYSLVVHLPYKRDKHQMEFLRLLNRYLQRDVGLKCYYFHYIRGGKTCACWSKELRASMVKNCPDCNGTGKIEGYEDPIELYVSFPPDSPTEVTVGHTSYQVLAPQAWTSNYPLIFPEDILIREMDKEIFIVQGEVRRSGRKLYPGKQTFNVQGIEHGSIEYNLIERIPLS